MLRGDRFHFVGALAALMGLAVNAVVLIRMGCKAYDISVAMCVESLHFSVDLGVYKL